MVHVQQTKDGIAHGSERLQGLARAGLGGVFAQCHITGPMQPIFDVPMPAHPLQDLSRQGVGGQTGHEVAPFMARRPLGVAGPTH